MQGSSRRQWRVSYRFLLNPALNWESLDIYYAKLLTYKESSKICTDTTRGLKIVRDKMRSN